MVLKLPGQRLHQGVVIGLAEEARQVDAAALQHRQDVREQLAVRLGCVVMLGEIRGKTGRGTTDPGPHLHVRTRTTSTCATQLDFIICRANTPAMFLATAMLPLVPAGAAGAPGAEPPLITAPAPARTRSRMFETLAPTSIAAAATAAASWGCSSVVMAGCCVVVGSRCWLCGALLG